MTAQKTETTAPLTLGDMGYSTIPAGLTPAELHAYRVGFDRGDRAYLKATGGPGVVHDGDAPAAGTAARRMLARTLAENGRAYRIGRHSKAHAAGMSAVRAYLKKTGQTDRVADIIDPLAPVKTARKLEPVPAACRYCGQREGHAYGCAADAPESAPVAPIDNSPETTAARRAMFAGLGWSTTPETAAAETVVAVASAPAPVKLRRTSKLTPCPGHAAYWDGLAPARRFQNACEGGNGASVCTGGECVLTPGTDRYTADLVARGPVTLAELNGAPVASSPAPVGIVDAARESGRLEVIHVTADPVAAPDAVPAPMPNMTRAARVQSRRELAATRRAAGLPVSGPDWITAKLEAGIVDADTAALLEDVAR